MILTMKRNNGDEEKKSTVFLLFCVSVGSFCDELTVVFCSFVRLFSTNSYAFKGGKGGGLLGSVSFSSFIWNGCGLGRKSPAFTARRNERMICTMGKGENKKKLKTEQ